MGYEYEITFLRNRVGELEKQVENLRISRRVLMNLIEKIEREKKSVVGRLEKENRKLLTSNQRYAKWLLRNNFKDMEAEDKINANEEKNELR